MVQFTLGNISERLTEGIIEKVFKMKINSEDNIKGLKVTRAAPAGEGLLSGVYRIQVTGNNHTASFVAKGLVNDTLLRKSLNCEKYFKREIQFFSTVLPVLKELQKSMGAKERISNNVPICYDCYCDGSNDYILLEDLADSQCKSIADPPTEYERDITLKMLAHLHAVSMAMRIKRPKCFDKITKDLPEMYYNEENRAWYSRYLRNGADICREALAQFEDPTYSVYFKKFNELINKDLYDQLINVVTRSRHVVICHGDAWCPNFLCSKERAVAVDFQLLRCASPATEVSFFLIMCGNLIRTKDDFMKSVKVYYDCLSYYLTDMGFEAAKFFSWDDFNDELKVYGKFGLLGAITTIPLICSERCDVLEPFEVKYSGWEKIPLEELWQLTPIKEEEHKMRLVNAVRISVDLGFI